MRKLMHKFMGLAAIVALALQVSCGGSGGGNSTPPPPSAQAPNIVFILADDLDIEGTQHMTEPQRLIAAEGMRFDQHFVSLSLCCPSRIAGLRGQFAHNNGIYKNSPPDGFEGVYTRGLEASTAATWLQGAGYRTALFGKYLNGYPQYGPSPSYIPAGWSEWYVPNGGDPYEEFDYSLNENGKTVAYGHDEADYMTDVISNKAADFIRRSVDQHPTQPFFAYIATYAPHAPATPAPRHKNAFPGAKAPRPASFNEADVSDKPAWIQVLPLLTADEIVKLDSLYQRRLQTLLAVDDLIRHIVETLEATGQLSNTYIIFTSDNGYHQGLHRMDSGKMTAFEEDLRIPMMVRGPGVPRGRVVTAMTANVDYAPTFAEIAGAALPTFVDGRSLLGILRGETPPDWRQALLLEHKLDADDGLVPGGGAKDGTLEPPDDFDKKLQATRVAITGFTGLRTVDGKTYVEYESGEHELYDIHTDAQQLKNGYDTAPADVKARLAGWLGTLRSAKGADLRQAEGAR